VQILLERVGLQLEGDDDERDARVDSEAPDDRLRRPTALEERSEEVAAHAFQVLGELDLSDPNPSPLITFWLYSHPPLADRLVFAHSYDPWSKGESPKYVK